MTPRFSEVIWHEALPALFAEQRGISLVEAKQQVFAAYGEVGDQRKEWYDIKYWFRRFGLTGYQSLLSNYRCEISYYDDVSQLLSELSQRYELIVISNSAREFLELLMETKEVYFKAIFSAISDFEKLKSADLYLEICRMLDVAPEEMVHVGDSWQFDFDIPRNVGVRAIHLDRQGQRRGDDVVSNLTELGSKLLS